MNFVTLIYENVGKARILTRGYGPLLLLVIVLLVAAGLRFYGLDWDRQMDAYPHPDERHLANTMSNVRLPWPPDWQNLLDPTVSTLNPRRVNPQDPGGARFDLAYGTLPVYLYRVLVLLFPGQSGEYTQFFLVGRYATAVMSLFTVFLIFLIGRLLFGRRVGLLASALLAVAVTHIQLSHFMTVDIALATFSTLALYLALKLVLTKRKRYALGLGLSIGCAMACKVSGLTLGAAAAGAGLLLLIHPDASGRRLPFLRVLLLMLLVLLGIILAFGAFEFYVLLDLPTYLEAIGRQAEMVSGDVDWPFTRQYVNTLPYLYHIENLVRWGLGWPSGILAFAGLIAALFHLLSITVRALRRAGQEEEGTNAVGRLRQAFIASPVRWGWLLLLLWGLPYFIQVGGYDVKFVRYMVLLAPVLCLGAAWLLERLAHWLGAKAANIPQTDWGAAHLSRLGSGWALKGHSLGKITYGLTLTLVLVPSFLWALAYTEIYRRPHTWHDASRWLYANAPRGSVFSEESWDDSLPVNLSQEGLDRGRFGFRNVTMHMYHDMPPEQKLQHIAGVLNEVDYVVLATPRLYGAVSRLPWRYPVEIRYYELLFQGRLGFELVYSSMSYPRLLGLSFVDDAADESFSVYDHPKALIFRKTRQLAEGEYRGLFSDALGATPLVTRELDEPPVELPVPAYRKSLMLDVPVASLPDVGDWAWSSLARAGSLPSALVWYLVLALIAIAVFPLCAVLFPSFPGKGVLLARGIGLLLVSYLCWLPASLGIWNYTAPAVWGALILAGILSWGIGWWRRLDPRKIWKEHRREILIGEAVFLAGFLIFLLLRILNPDLWHPVRGGEKPMELGFFNAILRSPSMPPYDPFFSGGYINYYYYGLFAVSTLVKLTGIHSALGFNLIIPTLAGLTFSGAFGVAWAVARRWQIGLAGGLFVTLVGNLAGAGPIRGRGGLGEVAASLSSLAGSESSVSLANVFQGFFRWLAGATLPLRTDWFWDASRAHGPYENTITEFPFFSFLFADLHPHVIGIPFGLLMIALCLSLVRSADQASSGRAPWIILLPALALGLGTMAVNNSWDFPVYVLLVAGSISLAHLVGRPHHIPWGVIPRAVLAGLLGGLILGALGVMLYAPFFTYFKAFVQGLGLTRYPTEAPYYLGVFGYFIYPLVTLLLGALALAVLRSFRSAHPREKRVVSHILLGEGTPGAPAAGAMADPALQEEDVLRSWEPSESVEISLDVVSADSEDFQGGEDPPAKTDDDAAPAPAPRSRSRWSRWAPLVVALLIPLAVAQIGPLVYGELNLAQMLTFVLLGELILGAVVLLLMPGKKAETRFIALLALAGLLVSLGVEVVYVRDHMGGDWYRMNTVFKFYSQIWVLFGVAAAGALWVVARRLSTSAGFLALGWWAVFGLLSAAVLVYPVFGSYTRVMDRFPDPPSIGTLDGRDYMRSAFYSWEGNGIFLEPDYEAILWLEENLSGTPVVLQAAWEYYRANGVRIAYNTGFPTVLNPLHADEQRYPEDKAERERDVHQIYNTTDVEQALRLLAKYRVDYVYVGPFERAAYSPQGIAKYAAMAGTDVDLVYDSGEVQIYSVRPAVRGMDFHPVSGPAVVPTVSPATQTRVLEVELQRIRRLADANPADAGMQFELGNRLRQAGRYEEAVEVFQRSLEHNPLDVAMYHTLGDAYMEMGHPDDALEQYRAAAAAAPEDPAAYNKLGLALWERGRYEEAVAAFHRIVDLQPDFVEAYFHLGVTLESMGNDGEAQAAFRRVIDIAPGSDWAARAGERLQAMLSEE